MLVLFFKLNNNKLECYVKLYKEIINKPIHHSPAPDRYTDFDGGADGVLILALLPQDW
jgi:hypothetical protein